MPGCVCIRTKCAFSKLAFRVPAPAPGTRVDVRDESHRRGARTTDRRSDCRSHHHHMGRRGERRGRVIDASGNEKKRVRMDLAAALRMIGGRRHRRLSRWSASPVTEPFARTPSQMPVPPPRPRPPWPRPPRPRRRCLLLPWSPAAAAAAATDAAGSITGAATDGAATLKGVPPQLPVMRTPVVGPLLLRVVPPPPPPPVLSFLPPCSRCNIGWLRPVG